MITIIIVVGYNDLIYRQCVISLLILYLVSTPWVIKIPNYPLFSSSLTFSSLDTNIS